MYFHVVFNIITVYSNKHDKTINHFKDFNLVSADHKEFSNYFDLSITLYWKQKQSNISVAFFSRMSLSTLKPTEHDCCGPILLLLTTVSSFGFSLMVLDIFNFNILDRIKAWYLVMYASCDHQILCR